MLFKKPGKGLQLEVDQVSRLLPRVSLHHRFRFQIPQVPQSQTAKGGGHGGDGCQQKACDGPKEQLLVGWADSSLRMLRTERPPLGAANTPSIRLRGHARSAVHGQPAVATEAADAVFGRECHKAAPMLHGLGDESETALLRRTGIWGGHAWLREVGAGGWHLNLKQRNTSLAAEQLRRTT